MSINQPEFCPNASWNPNATTFADNTTIGHNSFAMFINQNNSIFAANPNNGEILIWYNGNVNLTTTILTNLSGPYSLFVTSNDQIFVNNNQQNNRVDQWTMSSNNNPNFSSSTLVVGSCFGLFVDLNDNLYCSQSTLHQVQSQPLTNSSNTFGVVAGTGCAGSSSNMLNNPQGIFVTRNVDLYVADYSNNRIQLFRSGEMNATTVAGNGSNGTITLSDPSSVVLDANGRDVTIPILLVLG